MRKRKSLCWIWLLCLTLKMSKIILKLLNSLIARIQDMFQTGYGKTVILFISLFLSDFLFRSYILFLEDGNKFISIREAFKKKFDICLNLFDPPSPVTNIKMNFFLLFWTHKNSFWLIKKNLNFPLRPPYSHLKEKISKDLKWLNNALSSFIIFFILTPPSPAGDKCQKKF